jgi:putative addiction module CopG family antidote
MSRLGGPADQESALCQPDHVSTNPSESRADSQLLPMLLYFRKDSEISMPPRNISLTLQQAALIDKMLEEGEYRNASEAIRDAIRALQQRRAEEALKLDWLCFRSSKVSRRSITATTLKSTTKSSTPSSTPSPSRQ